jgi:hypothetical protein
MNTAEPRPRVRTARADLNQSPRRCSGPRYMSRNAIATRARNSAKSWTLPGYTYTERLPRIVAT